jgi:hypothetical protein
MHELAARYGRANRVRVAFLVASLAGCHALYPMPDEPDPATNKYLCPAARPSELTALVPVFALIAAYFFYEAKKPLPPPPTNCLPAPECNTDGLLGPPCCTQPDPRRAERDLAWFNVAAGTATAAAAVASWSEYARCTRLDPSHAPKPIDPTPTSSDERHDELEAMARTAMARMDAGDCDAIRPIAVRVRALDPVYYANVFLPTFGACVSR